MPRAHAPAPDDRPGPLAITFDVVSALHADAAAIADRQRHRLAALLAAARHTPRYQALLHGRDLQHLPLTALPPTGKHELMSPFEAGVADPALTLDAVRNFCSDPALIGQRLLDRYWVWHSSGSTGLQGFFVQDALAMAVYDALEATRRHASRPWLRLWDPLWLSERFAFVGATGGHFASIVSLQRLRRANPLLQHWQAFSILQPLPALVGALNAFGPTLLASYPTAATMLAEEAAAGRLLCRPYEVWTGGETLTGPMRSRIEHSFGATVRNSYGASEFLPIAWECTHGRLHVNADWVILEPVDAQFRPVPPGQVSHTTLLTNLANHLQPLIRFDIGDRIALGGERCPCGCALPVVQVQGRSDDAIVLPGADGAPVTLLPLALTTVLEDEAGVFDFELQQLGPGRLRLALGPRCAPDAALQRRCKAALTAFARRLGALPPAITVTRRTAAPANASGKVKRIRAATPPAMPFDHS